MPRIPAVPASALVLTLVLFCASTPVAAAPSPALTPSIAAAMKPFAGASKEAFAAFVKAEALSEQGNWKSAFAVVERFDAPRADPYALAMRIRLALRGSVRSEGNVSFAFVDLEPGQDLESLREAAPAGGAQYELVAFDPAVLAEAQAAKGVAAPGILSKLLGDYYIDSYRRFSGRWKMGDEQAIEAAVGQYAKALAAGAYDDESLLAHAEALVRLGRGDESDAIYKKGIELSPKNAELRYRYAMSLAYRGKKAESLAAVDSALEAYGEDPQRIGAIALGARLATELGKAEVSERYFALAEKGFPDSPTPGLLRLMVAVKAGDKAASAAAADAMLPAYGSNPNVVRTIVSTWMEEGDLASARGFLDRNIAKGGEGPTVGTLEFYLAVLIAQGEPSDADRAVALKALDDAEARFKAAFGEGSDALTAVAGVRDSLAKKDPAEPVPAPGAPSP
jgi:tetratricopeptide (TPR) repeat protein